MFPSTSVQIGPSDVEFVKFNNLDSNGKEIFTFSNSGGWLYLGAFILAVLFIITYFLTAFSWVEVGNKIEAADPINPPVKKSTANSYMIMNWVAAGFFILVALFLLYRVFTVKSWRINMERMKQLKEIKETGKKAAIDASIERESDLRLLEEISKAKATLPPDIEAESIEDKVNDLLARRTSNNSIISNIDERIKTLNDDYNRAIASFGPKDSPDYYTRLVASGPRLDEINNEIGKLKKSKDGFLAELRKIEKDLNVARYGSVPIKPIGTKTAGSGITLSAVDKLKQQAIKEIETEKIDYKNRLEPILNIINDWKVRKAADYNKAVDEIKKSIPGVPVDTKYIDGLITSEKTLIGNIENDINNFNLRPDVSLVSASGKIKTLKEQYNILQDIYSKIRDKIK